MTGSMLLSAENVFVYSEKKNVRKLEKALKKIPDISMTPAKLIENVRSSKSLYCGLKVKNELKLPKDVKGFAVSMPFGTNLSNLVPYWVKVVLLTDTDKDETAFVEVPEAEFFINKKGKPI